MAAAFNQWLKNVAGPLGWAVSLGVTATVKLVRYLTFHIGGAILDSSALAVGWINHAVKTVEYWATWALLWPVTMARVFFWLLDVEIPRLIHALPNAATKVFRTTVTRVVRIERTIVKFPKLTRKQVQAVVTAAMGALVIPYLPMLRWLKAHFHALTTALPHALPRPRSLPLPNLRKLVNRWNAAWLVGAGLGVLSIALAKLGLGWARCTNVRKVGKNVCGMNGGLLDSLLLDTVAIFSVISVVEFAKELRAVEDEAVAIMGKLVREWPG
jgi:hypothetical protein